MLGKSRIRLIGKPVALAVGLALVVAAGSAVYIQSSTARAQAASALVVAEAAAVVPEMGRPQTQDDELPDFLKDGPQAFENTAVESSRHIGGIDGITFWSALNHGGDVCLIGLMPGEAEVAVQTCGSIEQIEKQGLGVQFADRNQAIRVYLVPEGITVTDSRYTKAGPRVYVSAPTVADFRGPSVASNRSERGAAPFELAPMPKLEY